MSFCWKVYMLLLGLLSLAVVLLTSSVGFVEVRRSTELLREQQRLYAATAATQVESGYHERNWPFEMLSKIAKDGNFAAWRVVDGNGQIVLADQPLATVSEEELAVIRWAIGYAEPTLIPGPKADTETWIIPMRMRTGNRPWSFWLSFHNYSIGRQIRNIIVTNVISAAVIAILLLPVAMALTGRAVRPLAMLAAVAAEMERGNLDVSLPSPTRDEIGQLITSFGAMARSIKVRDRRISEQMQALEESRRGLEVRVQERTAELTKANQELQHEVAERRRIAESLRESEERFRQVAESAGEWIWETDAEGVYTYSSPGVERILGYQPDEIVGKMHFHDLFSPDAQKELKEAVAKAFAARAPIKNFINANLHKNGNVVVMQTNGAPILDKDGNLVGYRGTDTDITERAKAEEELRRSLGQLERFNRLAVGRELRMIELKREINEMAAKAGLPAPYDLSRHDRAAAESQSNMKSQDSPAMAGAAGGERNATRGA